MYSVGQIKSGLSSPKLGLREINRWYYSFKKKAPSQKYTQVFKEDWDNLIILDACRYDMFEQATSNFKGALEHRISGGSSTVEFLFHNFESKDLQDTVYVTANPQLYRHRSEIDCDLHDIINVWMEDGWDDQIGTVHPETMMDYTLDSAEMYPNKRIISHFIQPHYPFLNSETTFDKGHLEELDKDTPSFWKRIMKGELQVDRKKVWDAYLENLEITIPHIEKLVDSLHGETVITSDHGNMVGERSSPIPIREWGHPPGIYTEQLVKVPWLKVESNEEKEIVSEQAREEDTEVNEDTVSQRLRDLGYVE